MFENDQIRIVLEGKIGSIGTATFLAYSIESIDIKGRLNFDYSLLLAEATGHTVSCGKLCREPKLILSECRNCWIGYQNLFYDNGNHCSGINRFRHFDSDSVNPLYEAVMSSIRSYAKDRTLEHLNSLNSAFKQSRPTEKDRVINLYLTILDSYVIYNNLKSKNISNKLNAIRARIGKFDDFDQLANWIIETIESDTGLIDRMIYSAPVESALEYIESHFQSIRNIQEIADHINLSLDYFSRLFKKEVGDSLNSYLINYRLDKASIILISTDLSVQEVAEKVGIENGSYFSKCFKKKFHTQPVHFRIQTNKEHGHERQGGS